MLSWNRLPWEVVMAARLLEFRSIWTLLSDTGFSLWVTCVVPGGGLDGPCGSLPTWDIQSFCDSVIL